MSDPIADLQGRLAKLEAQVALLLERSAPPPAGTPQPPAPAPARQPLPPRPAPRPARPPQNPIVLVAAAGAGIFLLGALFFLHWSIQKGWVGPEVRFLMGLLAGGALAAIAARRLLGQEPQLGTCLLLAGLGTLMFTLRWGAFEYHFFPPALGLSGAFLCVLLAGGLAARARFGGALAVALGAGLGSPLVFSEGGHHEVSLAIYLAVVMAATLAVPYLTGTGAQWRLTRWLAVAGTWALLAFACVSVPAAQSPALLSLLVLHGVLAGLWIWLPGQAEPKPDTPTLLWFLTILAATSLGWVLWENLHWTAEWFAGPVLLVAGANLLLVKPLRLRLGGRQADLGLLVLAGGHLALAVPVTLDWQWVGAVWGIFALGAAWATHHARTRADWEPEEVQALRLVALGLAALASLRWAFQTIPWMGLGAPPTPFLNVPFLEGMVTAGAWALLARNGGATAQAAFLALEVVANVTLALELGRLARSAGGGPRMASIVLTLVWALSGALQWLRSHREERPGPRKALALAGYAWLGLASAKLLLADLAQVDTPLRALAFLGVGGIFLAAALAAKGDSRDRKELEP